MLRSLLLKAGRPLSSSMTMTRGRSLPSDTTANRLRHRWRRALSQRTCGEGFEELDYTSPLRMSYVRTIDAEFHQGKLLPYLFAIVLLMAGCKSGDELPDPGPPKEAEEIGKARVWVTSGDQSKLLSQGNDISITVLTDSSFPT